MRLIGKSYEQLQNFISAVKSGKKTLLVGMDYVCMNRETYDKLANPVDALVGLPPIKWQYEDELPELTDKEYDEMFDFSRVIDGVRMFPYMEINNAKHYLRSN